MPNAQADKFVMALAKGVMPGVMIIFVLAMLVLAFRFLVLPKLKGKVGEGIINFLARRNLDPALYLLIPDIMLPAEDATTQIDHVIVSRYGIFVIETKNYKGWIFGSERDAQWTQKIFKATHRFQNPLRQNYKHTQTLADLTGIPESYFKSMVVFIGESEFKTDMPSNVMYSRDFIRYIKSFQTPIIKDTQVPDLASAIREWAATVSSDKKAHHVANLRAKKAHAAASE